ncbi:MAG: hypothetical protein DRJ37_07325 [Thermoprotei archaeon]|nr:MAG: hypothetical protein DRJ37_07325 [Thermoprotei archaeon]
MKLLLDTSFILELKKKNKRAIETLRREVENAEDVIISQLTKYELMVGVYYLWLKNRNIKERIWLDDFLKWVTIAHLSDEAIERAAKIKAKALTNGASLPDMDLLIAVSEDPPVKLLTFDEDHENMKQLLEEIGIAVEYLKSDTNPHNKL